MTTRQVRATSPSAPAALVRPLLEVRNLEIRYGAVRAVDGVSFTVWPGERVGIVGESGSGKSTVLKAIIALLDNNAHVSGSMAVGDLELVNAPESSMARVRGSRIGMIFQDAVNVLNPALTIGKQLSRICGLRNPGMSKAQRHEAVLAALADVGIDGTSKLGSYPFEMSQGQIQRVCIAAACLAGPPELLLADEPTTSLDVTIEAQTLDMLQDLQASLNMSMILVSHDLAVIAERCDRVIVMYGGRIVEQATAEQLVTDPKHPYTRELLRSIPVLPADGSALHSMRGEFVPSASQTTGCIFAPRCPDSQPGACFSDQPPLTLHNDRGVACHLVELDELPAETGTGVRPR